MIALKLALRVLWPLLAKPVAIALFGVIGTTILLMLVLDEVLVAMAGSIGRDR